VSFGSSHDFKERVRQATDLVDLVSRSITLRRQGKQYVGLCPWHDDSRPSMQVNPDRQSWKCWVCNIGGDAFSFVMKREGVAFPEALRILADRAGIAPPDAGGKPSRPGSPDDKQTLYRALAWAEQQYHRCLLEAPEAEPARQYLVQRGISSDSVTRFCLGFSPNAWQWLLDRCPTGGFTPAVLEAAGLVSRSQDGRRLYDRFRGRLMFSIRDTEHRPIAFGARILPQSASSEGGPKYLNSPESRLFSKSNHLYGLDVVRESLAGSDHIVVVEGYTDVIMAHQHGLNHVVAALGTALGERHVRLLRRFADTITLVLDGDEAGQRRTNEVLSLFVAAQVDLRILTLPAGLDPCDFVQQQGGDAFRDLLGQAVDALEHKARSVTAGINLVEQPDHAHRALEEILRTMAGASPQLTLTSESLRLREQQMLARLARQFHVEEASLRVRLDQLRAQTKRPVGQAVTGSPVPELNPTELELFEILLSDPEFAPRALDTIDATALTSPRAQELWDLYHQARRDQVGFDAEALMTAAETMELKSAIVGLLEQAGRKAADSLLTPEERLNGLMRDFQFRKERLTDRQRLAALHQPGADETQAVALLERLIQHERDRQGLSAPTDG
jgi:DNA primase